MKHNNLSNQKHMQIEPEPQPTFARFNLAIEEDAYDLISMENGEFRERYLCVPYMEEVDDIESKLRTAGLRLLERSVEPIQEGYIVYEVPKQSKPLSNEKFYPDRESTQTYVSDNELYRRLGGLWSAAFRATRMLPPEKPLKHTGMLEFASDAERLFPIPPYYWQDLEDAAATDHFLDTLGRELQTIDPHGQHRALVDAAKTGWEE